MRELLKFEVFYKLKRERINEVSREIVVVVKVVYLVRGYIIFEIGIWIEMGVML